MPRTKYRYNPEACRYEPYRLRGNALRQRVLIFLSLSFFIAISTYLAFLFQFGSWHETLLKEKNEMLLADWAVIEEQIENASAQLKALADKDDNNYRVVLDSEPLASNIRKASTGGSDRMDNDVVKEHPVLYRNYTKLLRLKQTLEVQTQSYDALHALLQAKIEMWSSRPAIQPLNNKQLDRLHMTYGPRFHPILNRVLDHKGLDFAAPRGTPVYATGDGKITMAYYSDSYGNVLYVDHGYDYETRYAHLSRFAVSAGEKVKRGQIIGYVGNTGTSVSSHLHYEVLFRGQHVHPINFFQSDLSNEEYERLIEIAIRQDNVLD